MSTLLFFLLVTTSGGDGAQIKMEADKAVLLPGVPFQLTITVEGAKGVGTIELTGVQKEGKGSKRGESGSKRGDTAQKEGKVSDTMFNSITKK